MSKLRDIENNEEEIDFFSQLTHDYHMLAMQRITQTLRYKWGLNPEEYQEIFYSVIGRMMNESVYSLFAAMLNTGYPVEKILPPMTMALLRLALNNKVSDPTNREDVDITTEHYKDFVRERWKTGKNDFSIYPSNEEKP
jgi:hypothetical protein